MIKQTSPFRALRSTITTNAVIRLHRHGGPEWLKLDELLAGAAAARYVERERACFKETNIFPIMHVAAIEGGDRRSLPLGDGYAGRMAR
jgi:hypothetical protein